MAFGTEAGDRDWDAVPVGPREPRLLSVRPRMGTETIGLKLRNGNGPRRSAPLAGIPQGTPGDR